MIPAPRQFCESSMISAEGGGGGSATFTDEPAMKTTTKFAVLPQ